MSDIQHIFHLRFFKGKYLTASQIQDGCEYDKIISGVWSYNTDSNTLRYGATVYRKASKKDVWVGKSHSHTRALKRYTDNPVYVKLTGRFDDIRVVDIRKIAPFVVIKSTFMFGCSNKFYNVDGCVISIPYLLHVDTDRYEELAMGVYDTRYYHTDLYGCNESRRIITNTTLSNFTVLADCTYDFVLWQMTSLFAYCMAILIMCGIYGIQLLDSERLNYSVDL